GVVGGGFSLASLAVNGTGAITLLSVTTAGAQSYTGAVTLGAATVLTTTNSNVTFTATVNGLVAGAQSLTINQGTGTVSFGGVVGAAFSLASLAVNGVGGPITLLSVTTAGAQSYTGPVTLGANTVLTGTGLTFTSTVAGAGFNLTLTFTGVVAINGVNVTGVNNLASNGVGGTTQLTGNITTTGTQNYTNVVQLTGATVLATTNSNVTFGATVNGLVAGAQSLTINQGLGAVSFGGVVGGGFSLASLAVNGTGAITLLSVTTAGAQSYTGAVTLGAATVLTTTNSNVTFTATVNGLVAGAQSLTINQGTGTVSFGGVVGAAFSLASLAVNGVGGPITLLSVTTAGAQSYTGPVTLGANTVLTGTGLTFTSTVAGAGFNLTLTFTGVVAINGVNVTGVNNLASNGVGGTTQLTGNITTTGTQNYTNVVQLTGATVLATTNSNVKFGATVNGLVAGAQSLTINQGLGAVSFGGVVGGGFSLASLAVNGTGAITLRSAISTGAQSYTGPVTLGA